jgi:hypothetical protein
MDMKKVMLEQKKLLEGLSTKGAGEPATRRGPSGSSKDKPR